MAERIDTWEPPEPLRAAKSLIFLHGNLRKIIKIRKVQDVIVLFDFRREVEERYLYSQVQREYENAWPMPVVCKLLNRDRRNLYKYIKNWGCDFPQKSYDIPWFRESGEKSRGYRYVSDSEILMYHSYFMEMRNLRRPLPSRDMLKRMMRTKKMLYEFKDGELTPVWMLGGSL